MKRDDIAKRVAARHLEAAGSLISGPVYTKLSRTFRSRGMPFFDFYMELKRVFDTYQIETYETEIDLAEQFVHVARMFVRTRTAPLNRGKKGIPSPDVINQIQYAIKSYLRTPLRILSRNINQYQKTGKVTANLRIVWNRVIERLLPIYQLAGKDRGIYMRETLKTEEGVRWGVLRKMSQKDIVVDKLKDDEPDTYEWLIKKKATYKEIDIATEAFIERADLEPLHKRPFEITVNKRVVRRLPDGTREKFVRQERHMTPLVHVAIDPISNERYVATSDQRLLPLQTYLDERIQQEEARQRVEGNKRRVNPERVRQQARTLGDAEVDALEGDVSFEVISDDPANNMRLARIFPVKWYPDPATGIRQKVVVDGRYKGIMFDDLVNYSGRLMDDTLFDYDTKNKRPIYKDPKTVPLWEEDPHVTKVVVEKPLDEKGKQMQKVTKLMLVIPGKDVEPWLSLRDVVRKLAKAIPSIEQAPAPPGVSKRSHTVRVLFDPKDFSLIRENVQSMSLSKGALKFLEEHFAKQAKMDRAIAPESLEFYSAKELGGFKEINEHTGKAFNLRTKQMEAIAWLDASDNRGVCALDTGIGKTGVAVGSMQKMIRDGFLEDPTNNGRFLFVSPKALRGNIMREIDNFLIPEAAAKLAERVDAISYQEFASASRSKKAPKSISAAWGDRPWDAKKYIAVYFDEAQALKKFSSGPGQAAMKLSHPRKICLTASPMEREPMEAYILSAICNNINLGERRRGKLTKKALAARDEMRAFRDQYCEAVGGRVVSMKPDPLTQRDLHIWVKTNIFYADKTEVTDTGYVLGESNPITKQVAMPDELETVYRRVSARFAGLLRGLVRKFRELQIDKNSKLPPEDLEKIFEPRQKFFPVIQFMNALSNRPKEALETLAKWMEADDRKAVKPTCPAILWNDLVLPFKNSTVVSPEKLRETAAGFFYNPKVAEAARWMGKKLQSSDNSRAVMFTDDPAFVEISAREMSEKIPGLHAACLASKIKVFSAGMELPSFSYPIPMQIARELAPNDRIKKRLMSQYAAHEMALQENANTDNPADAIPVPSIPDQIHKLPFKQKTLRWQGQPTGYRKYTKLAPDPALNKAFEPKAWQTFVLNELIQKEKRFITCSMHGQTYQLGQNLQKGFDSVVHLDRDTWNSEDMKQRTARVWRSGQKETVDVVNIDMTYQNVRDPLDDTLDKIQEDFQNLSGALFDSIIKKAQAVPLGEEWFEMQQRNPAFMRTSEQTMALMASPYLSTPQPSPTK